MKNETLKTLTPRWGDSLRGAAAVKYGTGSISAVAEAIGLSPATVSKAFRGDPETSYELVILIARELDVCVLREGL